MDYKSIVENTIIPGALPQQKQVELYSGIMKYVSSKLPIKLYRFRACTERNISSFYNDELWFSNGSVMNDDFEARLYYDKTRIMEWRDSIVSPAGGLKPIEDFLNNGEIPEKIKKLVPWIDNVISWLKNLSPESLLSLSEQLIQIVDDSLENDLEDISRSVQSNTVFACFSERIKSDMMWGTYAGNATGFALEYSFDEVSSKLFYHDNDEGIKASYLLLPILYDSQRLDATDYAIYLFQVNLFLKLAKDKGIMIPGNVLQGLIPCPDIFMCTKIALKKSLDWSPEGEWRAFYISYDKATVFLNSVFLTVRPSGVYLGRKISEINQKIITEIAKEKGIPVYKMGFDEDSTTYSLSYSKIE